MGSSPFIVFIILAYIPSGFNRIYHFATGQNKIKPKNKKIKKTSERMSFLVGEAGLEPARPQ
jgi:hypothetical protein